jgi:hypothetical protein
MRQKKKWFNHSSALAAVLGGWQLGAVQRYQSGSPVSFGCATTIPGWDNCVRFNCVPGVTPYSAQGTGPLTPSSIAITARRLL